MDIVSSFHSLSLSYERLGSTEIGGTGILSSQGTFVMHKPQLGPIPSKPSIPPAFLSLSIWTLPRYLRHIAPSRPFSLIAPAAHRSMHFRQDLSWKKAQ
jgi:hypothetical protein